MPTVLLRPRDRPTLRPPAHSAGHVTVDTADAVRRRTCRLSIRDASIGTWTIIAASACSTRRPSSWARSRPARRHWPSSCGHRAGPPDGAPARGRARAPPPRRPRHQGRFVLGPRLAELAAARRRGPAAGRRRPGARAPLRDHTGESAQLYRRQGDQRVCVAAAERPMGLRDSIPVGAGADRCAPGRPPRCCSPGRSPTGCTAACRAPGSPRRTLSAVRRRGWAQSVGEREPGVASVSAPVRARPAGRRRGLHLRAGRAVRPAAGPRCTRPRSAAAARLTEVLRRVQTAGRPARTRICAGRRSLSPAGCVPAHGHRCRRLPRRAT